MLKENVQKADAFFGLLDSTRASTQQSVDDLEAKYLLLAEKLSGKVEEQHSEQLQRLEADKARVKTWLTEYIDEVKRAKNAVKMDPLEQLRARIQEIRQSQQHLQQVVLEQIQIEVAHRGQDVKHAETQAWTLEEIQKEMRVQKVKEFFLNSEELKDVLKSEPKVASSKVISKWKALG